MRFVDEQVVDAGGLEGDAGVAGGVELGLEPFLRGQEHGLELLGGQLLFGALGPVDPPADLRELAVHVGLLGVGGQRDPLERRMGDDDRVPVAGGDPGDELPPPVRLQVLLLGDQDLGLRVQLEEFPAELLQHVIGHADRGLAGQAQAPQLHRAHAHLGRLAGADLVEQADRRLVDDPGHRRDLVRVRFEPQRQAGQRQLRVVVAAQHDRVEQLVVDGGEPLGAVRVLPRPFGEPLGQLGSLLLRGRGLLGVQDAALAAAGGPDGVADLDPALRQDRLGQLRRRVPGGAPRGGGQHAVLGALDRPDGPAGMLDDQPAVLEDLAEELLHVAGADPGRAHLRGDLGRAQVLGQHLAQRGGVDREPRVVPGGLLGDPQLPPDVAGQVISGRDERSRRRAGQDRHGGRILAGQVGAGQVEAGDGRQVGRHVLEQPGGLAAQIRGDLEDQAVQAGEGFLLGLAEQPGDHGQPDLARQVQADRQRVGGAVGAEPGAAGGHDPAGEDVRLPGDLADRVEVFQGEHGGRERVGAETALRRPDPGHLRLAGLRVGPAGRPRREPVDRAVRAGVAVVPLVEAAAQLLEVPGVVRGGGLGFQQGDDEVAQAQQGPQLGGLAGRHLERPLQAAGQLGEVAARQRPQVPVWLAGEAGGRGRRRGGGAAGGGCPGQARAGGLPGDLLQGLAQVRDGVPGAADGHVAVPVGAVHGVHLAEDHLGAVEEPGVDRHLDAVELGGAGLLPRGGLAAAVVSVAAPEDQQVHDDRGAGGPLLGPAGQPDRADQVGQRGHLTAGGRVLRVQGEPGGEHRDEAARPGQVQFLDDEVVVDGVLAPVVAPVVQHRGPERHVADGQVEVAVGQPGGGERLALDPGTGVQRGGDPRGDRVELDAGDVRAVRGEADEVAAAAARLEDPAAVESQVADRVPDGLDDGGVGVVGVERVPRGRGHFLPGQQPGEFLAGPVQLGVRVVEDGRDGSPAGPAGQGCLLGRGCRAVPGLDGAQRGDRGEVGADPRDGAGRREVVLPGRAEPGRRRAAGRRG